MHPPYYFALLNFQYLVRLMPQEYLYQSQHVPLRCSAISRTRKRLGTDALACKKKALNPFSMDRYLEQLSQMTALPQIGLYELKLPILLRTLTIIGNSFAV